MVKYWQCGDHDWDVDEFVDKNVGEALQEYIVKDGFIMMSWLEGEPEIKFATGPDFEFEKKESLHKLIIAEIGANRPGGPDEDDLFFDPQGDRGVILLQELLRTYLKWRDGGVHQPGRYDPPND